MAKIKDMLREPKTLQEKKANQDWPVRSKRKWKTLITAWDDQWRSDMEDRSWKRHRRTQYKSRGQNG